MDWTYVDGENKADVTLYALSTCGWCKKTKLLLDELGVAYRYTYVDLLSGTDKDRILREVERWNPRRSFPTVVIGNSEVVVGFQSDRIKQLLRT